MNLKVHPLRTSSYVTMMGVIQWLLLLLWAGKQQQRLVAVKGFLLHPQLFQRRSSSVAGHHHPTRPSPLLLRLQAAQTMKEPLQQVPHNNGGGGVRDALFYANIVEGGEVGDDDDDDDEVEEDIDDDEEHEDEHTKSWLTWLSTGTRRRYTDEGKDQIKMRESPKLGGLPRSQGYASKDWLRNFCSMPSSAILRDIRSPVMCIGSWATLVSLVHRKLLITNPPLAQHMCIPTNPHSLLVSALGLLLVFRTNSAYQRFAEGRKIWEEIQSYSRDLSRMIQLYESEIGVEKRRRVQRLLAAFPYLLRHRIRPNLVMRRLMDKNYKRDPENSLLLYDDMAQDDNDAEAADFATTDEGAAGIARRKTRELYWVDKRTLPWRILPENAMVDCARAQNRPLWVVDRMAKEIATVPDQPNFTARERLSMLGKVDNLSHRIGQCERIHQTVVPLNYARHCLRSLTIWLLSLPFAMVDNLGLMTGPVIAAMSWLLFGVYEIGYSIEDPFQGTLRLSILCDAIKRDVFGEDLRRETAFRVVGEYEDEFDDDDGSLFDDDDDREEAEEVDVDGTSSSSSSSSQHNGIKSWVESAQSAFE